MRAVRDAGHDKARCIADLLRVLLADVLLEGFDCVVLDEADRGAAEARARHARTDDAILLPCDLSERIEFLARHFVVVAQREVRLVHQAAELLHIVVLESLDSVERAVVLVDSMACAVALEDFLDVAGNLVELIVAELAGEP